MAAAVFSKNAWRRWLQLTGSERRLLLRCVGLLMCAQRRLAHTDFQPEAAGSHGVEAAFSQDAGAIQAQRLRAHQMARIVAYAAAVCPANVACLHRSLVLWQLLGEEGIPRRMRIGVRKAEDDFSAHAWVECHGEPLHEAADVHEQFSAFAAAVVPVRRWGGVAGRRPAP